MAIRRGSKQLLKWMIVSMVCVVICLPSMALADSQTSSGSLSNTPANKSISIPLAPPPSNAGKNVLMTGPVSAPANGKTIQMKDIHDIKDVISIGTPTRIFLIILMVVIGVGLLIALVFILKRFIHRKKTSSKIIPTIPCEDLANNALKALKPFDKMDIKEFYFRLSAIFRQYLYGRFGIEALEMTTEELLPKFESLDIEYKLLQGAKYLVRETEPIKFAGKPATIEKMNTDYLFVQEFVEKTTQVHYERLRQLQENAQKDSQNEIEDQT